MLLELTLPWESSERMALPEPSGRAELRKLLGLLEQQAALVGLAPVEREQPSVLVAQVAGTEAKVSIQA